MTSTSGLTFLLLLLSFVGHITSEDTTAEASTGDVSDTTAASEAESVSPDSESPTDETGEPGVSEDTETTEYTSEYTSSTTQNIYGLDDKCASPSVVIPPFMHCVEVGCIEREPCQTYELRNSYCCPHKFGFDTVTCCLFAGGNNNNMNQGENNGGTYQPVGGYPYQGGYQPPYPYPRENPFYSWG